MKNYIISFVFLLCLLVVSIARAQLKNLDKRIESKVIRKVDQKADRTIDKALSKGEKELDRGVNEAVKKDKTSNEKVAGDSPKSEQSSAIKRSNAGAGDKSFSAYTKFDFVPGEKIIFYDDFSQDNAGDFPVKWNTNGSGEVVSTDEGGKWFEMKGNSVYLPLTGKALPENYTIEFDLKTSAIDNKLSSNSYLIFVLDENETFTNGRNLARVKLPYSQYIAGNIQVENRVNGKEVINNKLSEDIRKKMKDGTHVSAAVNKRRLRLWMDEQKVIDIPTLVPPNVKALKLSMTGFSEDFKNYHFYLGNMRIAEGNADIRSKLITEGKLVTRGILFDVNSDKIKPESHGVVKEIAAVLKENETIKIKIVGHTDADGDDKTNLELSQKRALSVKSTLAKEFGIPENRMETDGKGENEPSDKSNTPEGKANNRRVEFLKL